jgi:hypothetical protein
MNKKGTASKWECHSLLKLPSFEQLTNLKLGLMRQAPGTSRSHCGGFFSELVDVQESLARLSGKFMSR